MYLKVRKFLVSFIITFAVLALIAGLSTADFNSRSVSGNLSDKSILAFAPSNEGLDIKVFENKYTLTTPDFLIKAKGAVISFYGNTKVKLGNTLFNYKFYVKAVFFIKRILEKIVETTRL